MKTITLKITCTHSDILELKKTTSKETIIMFKNGDKLTVKGKYGTRLFKNLFRNIPGEPIN